MEDYVIIIIVNIYFENVYFLHDKLGSDICPCEVLHIYPWILLIQAAN